MYWIYSIYLYTFFLAIQVKTEGVSVLVDGTNLLQLHAFNHVLLQISVRG